MFKFLCFLILLGSPVFASSLKITIAGTAQGQIEIDLFEDIAPLHVAQISKLAEQGQYDNVIFHRVIEVLWPKLATLSMERLEEI